MFSIKIDNDIHKGIDLISIDFLIPHEEVLLDKKEILNEKTFRNRGSGFVVKWECLCK